MANNQYGGYFDNIKFFVKNATAEVGLDPTTQNLFELEVKFVCENCKVLINHEDLGKGSFTIPCTPNGIIEYHKAKYFCEVCTQKNRERQQNQPTCTCAECAKQN